MLAPSRREIFDPKRKLKKPGSRVKAKHTYRVRARRMDNDNLTFYKVRTKNKIGTIQRVASLKGLIPDRITV